MADRYPDFATLAAAHEAEKDYQITVKDRGTPVVILAPHGGTIEPETAQIAQAVAADDLSFYLFEALRPGAHGDFHITSHRFDEPNALALVARSVTSVAVHGFAAELNTALPGVHPTNICNRTLSGAGVQLELSRSLRHALSEDTAMMDRFSAALRKAITKADTFDRA
ncbi:poly-gamma-glutamate hydrolase family protein [Thalassovita sp.]|uniref:poly-gamma-glutamate hydrolase family protein n=1 Tax=Thalassovita sp. TaxID=1979401 RepID=UPI002B26A066|nr:poly-gamma-glutamate hydrolase family protein [Thalassovita sp.]